MATTDVPVRAEQLSRTALRARRLVPAAGQAPSSRVWSHRRRAYIDLFDAAGCVALPPARSCSAAQLAALARGRQRQAMVDCACCRAEVLRTELARGGDYAGVCRTCIDDLEAQRAVDELADAQSERRDLLQRLLSLSATPAPRTFYLDTETTGLGLDPDQVDELLEVAIVDDAGDVVLHTLVRPLSRTEWAEAQAIHGISPADVADAPTLPEISDRLEAAIAGADVLVIYNADFDLGFLPCRARALASARARCAMSAASAWTGYRAAHTDPDRRRKLVDVARDAGHAWTGPAHRALSDAHAVRTVWRWLRTSVATSTAAPGRA